MVSRTNLNLHPAEQGQCYSHPRKGPFFDTKSKCGPNSRPKVPLARINTGEQALFRLPENSAKSPLTQVQNRGFLGFVKSTPFCPSSIFGVREKHAILPQFHPTSH